jgi:hypothetical protein
LIRLDQPPYTLIEENGEAGFRMRLTIALENRLRRQAAKFAGKLRRQDWKPREPGSYGEY